MIVFAYGNSMQEDYIEININHPKYSALQYVFVCFFYKKFREGPGSKSFLFFVPKLHVFSSKSFLVGFLKYIKKYCIAGVG